MLKFIIGLLVAFSSITAYLSTEQIIHKDASKKEAPLFAIENIKKTLNQAAKIASSPTKEKTATEDKTPAVSQNAILPLLADAFLPAQSFILPTSRNWNIPDPKIGAQVALVYDTDRQAILYQKNNLSEPRPIASLTKLMTALVTIENAKLSDIFKVDGAVIDKNRKAGSLIKNEELTVDSLLHSLLIESSNDAAQVLSENIPKNDENISLFDEKKFIDLMNEKAQELDLRDTKYFDASGLSSENISSASDLVKIMREVLKYEELTQIMQKSTAEIQSVDGLILHHLISTNKLLDQIPDIIGGKTGYTEEAGNCMILAIKSPSQKGEIISVVMNSPDRIGETKELADWTKKAYIW